MPNTCENIREELVRINVVLPVVGQGCIFSWHFPPPFACEFLKSFFSTELWKLMILGENQCNFELTILKKRSPFLFQPPLKSSKIILRNIHPCSWIQELESYNTGIIGRYIRTKVGNPTIQIVVHLCTIYTLYNARTNVH